MKNREKLKEIQKNYQILKELKFEMNNKKINYNPKIKLEEVVKKKKKLMQIRANLNKIESSLKYEISEIKYNNCKYNIFRKCQKCIKINNKRKMKYIVMKKTLEDNLLFLRKGFERNIISFEKMIEQNRVISREIFYINYFICQKNNI